MPASTYAGDAMLNLLLRGIPFTPPTRVYISLHTADPGPTGANEVSTVNWPSYVRKDPALGAAIATGFDEPVNKVTQNVNLMDYGAIDGVASVTITHQAVWDADVAGNMIVYGALTTPKTFAPSDECLIKPTKLIQSVL